MIELLFAYAFISLTVPGFVQAVRALPWVNTQVMKEVKPWSCDICMCFWTSILSAIPMMLFFGPFVGLAAGPAYTTSMYIFYLVSRPTSLPPPPSFLE